MKNIYVIAVAFVLLTATVASAGKKEPESTPVTLSCKVPVLDTVSGYPWEISKDGVTIQLLPVRFEPVVAYHRTLKIKPKGILSLSSGTAEKYIVTEEPVGYLYKPDTMSFQLHITNHMTHVLRFQGCVTSFVVDGKSLPFDSKAQEGLLTAVVLPQGSMDVTLKGPQVGRTSFSDSVKTLLDTAKIIQFSIFDVTTEVDAANNPTKRATFEWIFANNPRPVSGTFQKTVTEAKLEAPDAQKMDNQWYAK